MNISFTGHREYNHDRYDKVLRRVIEEFLTIEIDPPTIFWSGMAVGFDLAAAEIVMELRERGADVKLCCAVPYSEQAAGFNSVDSERYKRVLSCADRVEVLSERYWSGVFAIRNDFLIEQADCMVAYFDETKRGGGTAYTVKRAIRRGLRVDNIYEQVQLSLF